MMMDLLISKPIREHINQAYQSPRGSRIYTDLEINHKDSTKGIPVAHYAETLGLSSEANFCYRR